jgi:DNA adenine methylase
MGSKNRIAKHLLPLMLSYAEASNIKTWVEPFVGGANMIDKVPASFERIGYDLNAHVIAALIDIRDRPEELFESFTEAQRSEHRGGPARSLYSHACIVTSFGADLKGGYAREAGSDDRTFCGYGKRNAVKQSLFLQGVRLEVASYEDLSGMKNAVIYCGPPYQGATGYKTGAFNHVAFWDWCRKMSESNIVFISEYQAPDDFICLWSGEIKTNFASSRKAATHNATEKLFTYSHADLF